MGNASTNSGEPTTALAKDLESCNVRDLFSVTTTCCTSWFRDCASAYFKGPDKAPNSTPAIVTGMKSKFRRRVEDRELLTQWTIRRAFSLIMPIATPHDYATLSFPPHSRYSK